MASNISDVGPAPSLHVDPTPYTGKKVKIAKVELTTRITDYDEEGNFVEGLAREAPIIRLTTESIGTNDAGEAITISEDINLKTLANGKVVWSTHPKSGMAKLFAKYKVSRPEQMVGREVMLIERVSSKNPDRRWLGFETA